MQWVKLFSYYLLWCSYCLTFGPFKLGHILTYPPSFCQHFLTSGPRCSKFILHFLCHSLGANHFSREGCNFLKVHMLPESFQSWDSFPIHVVETERGDFQCKILFRILVWLFSFLDWIWSNLPTFLYQKNYGIRIFWREKNGRKRRKTDMPATKVAGLAQNNLVFNILAAKLKKELHGEKMPSAQRTPSETLTCWQRQAWQQGTQLALCCGNKEPFRVAFWPDRLGICCGEEAARPGYVFF